MTEPHLRFSRKADGSQHNAEFDITLLKEDWLEYPWVLLLEPDSAAYFSKRSQAVAFAEAIAERISERGMQ